MTTTKTSEMTATVDADNGVDVRTAGKVIESIVLRGDLSALGPAERARFYVQMCNGLGLNPSSQPFAFLRLNGKEILYATRGATDQLAAIHKLTREIVDGPKVIDLAGTKAVYACARAKHPNGRVETSVATVPLVDPINALMKCETKAKRRVTLSILGLGLLDEMELETIPTNVQEPAGGVDFSALEGTGVPENAATQAAEVVDVPPAEIPAALEVFHARVAEIELPGECVAVWLKFRAELAPLSANDREAAWKALCARCEDVGRMKNAKVWLKKAIAEEDARRGNVVDEPRGNIDVVEPRSTVAAQRTQPAQQKSYPAHDTFVAHVAAARSPASVARAVIEYRETGAAVTPDDLTLAEHRVVALGVTPERAASELDALIREIEADRGPRPDGTTPGSGGPGKASQTAAKGSAANTNSGRTNGARAQHADPATDPRGYFAAKGSRTEIERAVRAHHGCGAAFLTAAVDRLDAITEPDHLGARPTRETLARLIETWRDEGARRAAETQHQVKRAA